MQKDTEDWNPADRLAQPLASRVQDLSEFACIAGVRAALGHGCRYSLIQARTAARAAAIGPRLSGLDNEAEESQGSSIPL